MATSDSSSRTTQISWEYLMPKRRERAGRYMRESDERLVAGTTTMESQIKLVNDHCESQGYICEPKHEWKEAISSVEVPYMEREELLAMLAAAKRKEFDVLVVSEIRAISRRQVEVLVIYDMLLKYGVRLETVKEKFGEDAMSKAILSLRAMFVEIEVEQSKMRMLRGRKDRVEIGQALNGHGQAGYGHVFVDSEREQKATYGLDTRIVYTNSDRKDWTPVAVIHFMRDCLLQGTSLKKLAFTLTTMEVPTPNVGKKRKGNVVSNVWRPSTIHHIMCDPRIMGVVYTNKVQYVNGKQIKKPLSEQTRLPDCPPIITPEEFAAIQKQFQINKEEALRNNKQSNEGRGLFRAGYCLCGICNCRMTVRPSKSHGKNLLFMYICRKKTGRTDVVNLHATTISQNILDREGWKRAVEAICHPALVREQVGLFLEQNKEIVIDRETVNQTVASLNTQIGNLFTLAQQATTDETIKQLAELLNGLESRKQQALSLLYDIDDEDEEQEAIERELVRFEEWAEKVRPSLGDPLYTPTIDEQRLAIRILGLRCTVFPEKGEHPFRYEFTLAPPEIMKLLSKHCIQHDGRGRHQGR